ncbi:MAG TPA: DUF6282 family protein [Candidatus Saccharimonadales bacterium]|nr:DUF6282 family protein [Candidatus Saccharimonadales bacterium]
MTKYNPLLLGAIELHCHSDPSIFPRLQTDWELIDDIKAAGMAGVVLKSHESLTSDRATLIRAKEPGLHVYGGLVCNYFTGGLSPSSVDVAIRLGAKIIWMPTLSSHQHMGDFAKKKTRFFASERPLIQPEQGLTIWDDQQNILPEVHQILQLIGEADIILATGHLSVAEVVALVDAAQDHGVTKILVQHADLGIAAIPLDIQIQLAQKGVMIEKCYLATGADFNDLSAAQMADSINQIGAESCVMVTDYGQEHNISPVQALSKFVDEMLANGISETAITQMIVANPRKLLNL